MSSMRRYNEDKLVSSYFMTFQTLEELEANHFYEAVTRNFGSKRAPNRFLRGLLPFDEHVCKLLAVLHG